MGADRHFRLLLFAILFLSSPSKAQESSIERIIESLRSKQSVDFTLFPTFHAYQALCTDCIGCENNTQLHRNLGEICSTVMKSEICKDVPDEKKLDCEKIESRPQIDLWLFLKGCSKGVFDSVETFLSFIWDIMKWVWSNTTDGERRSATIEQATEYMNIVKLYLHTEFEKSYARQSPPLRTVKALEAMGGTIASLLLNNITTLMAENYRELGCLNFAAKSKIICQFVGDIFIPPAAAISLLKYGPQAVTMFPNLRNAFAKLDATAPAKGPSNLPHTNRIQESERLLKRTMGDRQRRALIAAHELGKGQIGKNGDPAQIGNYTLAQLKEKASLLKGAGFSQAEVRELMENGIIGLSASEAQEFSSLVAPLFAREPLPARPPPDNVKPASSLPKTVERLGLTPRDPVALGPGNNARVGEFFQDKNGRIFTVVEVEINGQKSHQLYYRSNSQTVFRLLPARNKDLMIPQYDKGGLGENMLNGSPELQAFLSQQLKDAPGKQLSTLDPEEFEGMIPVHRSLEDYIAYKSFDTYVDQRFVNVNRILSANQHSVSSRNGRKFAKPEDVKIVDSNLQPDYRSPKQSYDITSPIYGTVKAYVYKSKDGSIEYTLLRDSENRIWFGDVGYANASLTHHGLRSSAIDAEELTTPLWEYHDHIPRDYVGEMNPSDDNYSSAWSFIKRMPEVQRWYQENGLPVPE